MHVAKPVSASSTTLLILASVRATRLGGVCKTLVHVDGRPILEHSPEELAFAEQTARRVQAR